MHVILFIRYDAYILLRKNAMEQFTKMTIDIYYQYYYNYNGAARSNAPSYM